ncbi:MAG: DUF4874 domain-containing protein [Oscillospiraceae bacterium]|jgi:hypothetical protein|nr:DUF4874 domain-containing protein [Oscillospiraceae bacterium]
MAHACTFSAQEKAALLRNPDRGLRMETYLTPGEPPQSYPGGAAEDPYERLLRLVEKYREDSPTVTQLYIYLSRYREKPLDDRAFGQMDRMLELCRAQGLRVLLRFAYQNEHEPDAEWDHVRGHLDQLTQWFAARAALIDETVCAVQAGVVGAWGEGHSNERLHSRYIGQALDAVCRMTPENLFVQVRTLELMEKIAPRYQARLALHDDYLIGEPNGVWSFFLNQQPSPAQEARFCRTLNDAEMPWGRANYMDKDDGAPLHALPARDVLRQVKQYCLSTLSLEHNYREDCGPTAPYSLARWKDEMIAPEELARLGLPCLPALFEAGRLSVYDYLRYHLGYLLTIPEMAATGRRLRFAIQNHGFAAPLNCNYLCVAAGGKEYPVEGYDKFALGSMQRCDYVVDLPEEAAGQTVEIKLARSRGSGICVAFAGGAGAHRQV